MKELDLSAIWLRADNATEGPWEIGGQAPAHPEEVWQMGWGEMIFGDSADGYRMDNPADALFIAGARSDVPALLDEVERLRGLVAKALVRLHESIDHTDMLYQLALCTEDVTNILEGRDS